MFQVVDAEDWVWVNAIPLVPDVPEVPEVPEVPPSVNNKLPLPSVVITWVLLPSVVG